MKMSIMVIMVRLMQIVTAIMPWMRIVLTTMVSLIQTTKTGLGMPGCSQGSRNQGGNDFVFVDGPPDAN